MYNICCIGHLTLDKVVTTQSAVHMAGGTAYYFSNAMSKMDKNYILVTAVAPLEMHFVSDLRAGGVQVEVLPSAHTVYFENTYSDDQDHRTQRVLQTADAFTAGQLAHIHARIFHLGPLLAGDIPLALLQSLSERGTVSLDVQGYLRMVVDKKVLAIDWPAKREALRYVDILKASLSEMEVLTDQTDIRKGAEILAGWGAGEVIITMGSKGSLVYKDNTFFDIPAYSPGTAAVDATGCGDTYMAGYLYQRSNGAGPREAGEFAAAMATLKIQASGAFHGTREEVYALLNSMPETSTGPFPKKIPY
jgi:sugar/nucleoside kinase (ribokinase family)